ncbi:MAG TPA: class I SAM-dependent methyltransferase [Ilumatobacter sp.]|nr:class I SAM-dependent methyltransferase [Ilumatobacter sp.]
MDAQTWNQRYSETELMWSAGPNLFVEQLCRDLPPGRSIDLAAGEGRNAIWLAEQGWDSTAVDYSDVAIDKARQIAERRGVTITAEVADLTTYEPTLRGYDLVVIAYLQLTDEQLTPILRRAAASVAAGGTFVLVCHDRDNLEHGYGGPQHLDVLTTPDQVVAAIGDELTVDRAEVAQRHVQTDDGERVALDTLVLARRPA